MNRSVRTAGSSTRLMNRTFHMIQLNVRKQDTVLESLMNDEETQDATILAIQEPWARKTKDPLLTTPMSHHKWTTTTTFNDFSLPYTNHSCHQA